jgi:hypothetical protein
VSPLFPFLNLAAQRPPRLAKPRRNQAGAFTTWLKFNLASLHGMPALLLLIGIDVAVAAPSAITISVSPTADCIINGQEGGSFAPVKCEYVVTTNRAWANVQVSGIPPWLIPSTKFGRTPLTLTLMLDQAYAARQADGNYLANITFSNVTSGAGSTTQKALLTITDSPPPPPPPTTMSLNYNGMTRDVVGPGENVLADGRLDAEFAIALSETKTITKLTLSNGVGGVWDTVPSNGAWFLGITAGGGTGVLLNTTTADLNTTGMVFLAYAADAATPTYILPGMTMTFTAQFSDGGTATSSVVIPSPVPSAPSTEYLLSNIGDVLTANSGSRLLRY